MVNRKNGRRKTGHPNLIRAWREPGEGRAEAERKPDGTDERRKAALNESSA